MEDQIDLRNDLELERLNLHFDQFVFEMNLTLDFDSFSSSSSSIDELMMILVMKMTKLLDH